MTAPPPLELNNSSSSGDRGIAYTADSPWTPAQRFGFRLAVSYFGLCTVGPLLDGTDETRRIAAALVRSVEHAVLQAPANAPVSDATATAAAGLTVLCVATCFAAVWTALARRTEYRRLHGWCRISLRYFVGAVMIVYGALKIIDVQFPTPTLDWLTQPVGSMPKMTLLWTYMGTSVLYTMFAGLGEWIGAFLLFFRRTTTLGAVILCAVLSNVALINWTYDVSVKGLSTNLLIAAILLALPDAHRLIDMFIRHRPTEPASVDFPVGPRVARLRKFAKPLLVAAAVVIPLSVSAVSRERALRPVPLRGVYRVDSFARNGVAVPPLLAESRRWRSLVLDRRILVIRRMDDSLQSFSTSLDTVRHTIAGRTSASNSPHATFIYATTPTGLAIDGMDEGDTVHAVVHRENYQPRLLSGSRKVSAR